ncbi:MAG: leucyl/phenylalanyl-tRNA--protein transferase [Deltaproteobacteria bacterium]|nr:leucyl/phenylalanyl-tRNA--protein transferase [Deltaproteobacteria bacterium]
MTVFQLTDNIIFPPAHLADDNGLLAVGGDLSSERLKLAYEMGIFPWYSEDDPILWWAPDPRLVLFPSKLKISRSLRKIIKKDQFKITLNNSFEEVINSCAEIRIKEDEDTWILDEMQHAYIKLHEKGLAHSVEAWLNGELVGGLYGVSLGKVFFGESMFSTVSNASKVAFTKFVNFLSENSFDIIDCQVKTDHLSSLGAEEISRAQFLKIINQSTQKPFFFDRKTTI